MPWLRHRPVQTSYLLFLIFLTCCLSLSSATVYIEEQMVETQDGGSGLFGDLADSGTLLVDPTPYANPNEWTLEAPADDLRRRDDASSTSSSTPTTTVSASTTLASSTTSSGLIAATPLTASQLPVPFDLGFSNNLTTSCQNFMTSMLSNSTFKSCLPFSLLLQVCPPIGPSL